MIGFETENQWHPMSFSIIYAKIEPKCLNVSYFELNLWTAVNNNSNLFFTQSNQKVKGQREHCAEYLLLYFMTKRNLYAYNVSVSLHCKQK